VIKITWDHGFKRAYARSVKNDDQLKTKFWKAMGLFSTNPFDNRLRTHKLTGKLRGLWAFSVDHKTRVIFSFPSDDEALLVDIGGHDEVY
jgi:mRNA-degrading endonuclease YafQ of YafQ-DinJ toxin-antitoxin module